jgi:CBS domain-containing protein
MKVKDVMKRNVVSVDVDSSLADVKKKMIENNVNFVVVKAGGEIVGVISDTDILAYATKGKRLEDLKAEKYMTACKLEGTNPCLQVFEDDPLEEAATIMAATGVHHLLVWGKSGYPAGVITSDDILKVVK